MLRTARATGSHGNAAILGGYCLRLQQVCRSVVMFMGSRRQTHKEMERRQRRSIFLYLENETRGLGFLDLELYLLEDAGCLRKLGGAGGKLVRAEHERQDV